MCKLGDTQKIVHGWYCPAPRPRDFLTFQAEFGLPFSPHLPHWPGNFPEEPKVSEQKEWQILHQALLQHFLCMNSFIPPRVGCCCSSVPKFCLHLCNSSDCSMPGFPVLHYLLKFAQICIHRVSFALLSQFTDEDTGAEGRQNNLLVIYLGRVRARVWTHVIWC